MSQHLAAGRSSARGVRHSSATPYLFTWAVVAMLGGIRLRGGEEPSKSAGPAPRAALPEVAQQGESTLDWVLSKVDAHHDEWRFETLTQELGAQLRKLGAALDADADFGPVLDVLVTASFRGSRLVPERAPSESLGTGTVERGERGDLAGRLEKDAFAVELAKLRRAIPRLSRSYFKVFDVRPGADGETVVTRVLLESVSAEPAPGGGATSGSAQLRTIWDVGWQQGSADTKTWRIGSIEAIEYEVVRIDRRVFVDVAEALFGGTPAFDEQFSLGAGDWYTRLDSASGIDIYGHQGIAVGDVDGDGFDDVYVAQASGLPNRLFRGRPDGTFEDRTEESGVGVLDGTGGPLLVDLDGDHDLDLVLPVSLEVLLWENDGRGRFRLRRDCGLEAASDRRATVMGLAAADADGDGDVDLYAYAYIFWAGAGSKRYSSYPFPYHDANNGAPNFLFRNEGGLRFRDVTNESGLGENNRRFSLAASWCDYDDDGDPDLYVANDFGENNLYRNEGSGRFRDVAVELGVEDRGNGMSVAWYDYDADGRSDLYVGNMWSSAGHRIAHQPRFGDEELRSTYLRMARGNSLFRNLGEGRFEDTTLREGVAFGRWAWSSSFLDVEGDGEPEIYVANGFVMGPVTDDL
jgi:hypothetical protein